MGIRRIAELMVINDVWGIYRQARGGGGGDSRPGAGGDEAGEWTKGGNFERVKLEVVGELMMADHRKN